MKQFWDNLVDLIMNMTIFDLIDILLVSFLIYIAYRFINERRAGKLALGVLALVFIEIISQFCNFKTISFLMSNIFQVGIVALVVIFQPELRSALEKVGGFREYINPSMSKNDRHAGDVIKEICDAVCDMSLDKTGALIVFERSTKLGDILKSGTTVNADVSKELIKNLFYKNSPLHDGAMVIRDWRILSSKCMLPLTINPKIDREFATRHRAAIGMSECSDAVVVVVSEQTGVISIAISGELKRNYDYKTLQNELTKYLVQTPVEQAVTLGKPKNLLDRILKKTGLKADKKDNSDDRNENNRDTGEDKDK